MGFATLAVDFVSRMAGFEEGLNKASRQIDNLGNRVAKVDGLIGNFGKGLAGSLTVGAITAYAKGVIDFADSLNDMNVRTGVAVKTLAEYRLAADQNGTSLEALANGIQKLSLSIGQAENDNKDMAKALVNLGVTARDPQKAFEQLADAVAKSNDPVKTNTDLQKVLGKNYAELLPLLRGGAQGLRDSATASKSFADQMAKMAPDADKFNDNLATMKTNAAGAASTLIGPLVSALNDVFERFDRLSKLDSATFFEKLTGQISADLPSSIANVNGKIKDLEADIERLTRNSNGQDSSILPLKQELARLKQLKSELRSVSLAEAMKLADAQYKKPPAGYSAPGTIQTPGDKTGKTRSTSDPLAGLLASTDIGRLREFDKQVALLNQRFAYGKKDTELYSQAMTKLIESTFSNNFKQAADDAEFFRQVEQDGIKTSQEWAQNLRDLANVDMGKLNELLANTDFERLKQSQEDMVLLTRAFTDGIKDADGNLRKLSESEYLDAVSNRLGLLKNNAKEAGDAFSTFAEQAGRNIQDAFAEYLTNPFDKGMKGMLQSFGQTIQKMIAQAVAADLAKRIFNWGDSGGGQGSLFGSIATAVFSGARADGGPVMGGSTYLVGERGPELFTPSTSGAIVPNHALGGASAGHTINVYVQGGSAPDVRRAAGQGAREALAMIQGAQRYA